MKLEVLRHEFTRQALILQEGKVDAAPLENLLQLSEVMALEMSAEVAVEIVHGGGVRRREERIRAVRLEHVHQHEMLSGEQAHVAGEAFRKHGIFERREEDQQRTAAQARADERADLVEVRRDVRGFERVDGVAAGGVVALAVLRAGIHEDWAVISRLFVKPEYRGLKFSQELMHLVFRDLHLAGITKAALQVDVSNEAAIALYKSLGFRKHHEYSYVIQSSET